MFSSLRPNATLYILDKSGEPEVKIGYVENVTPQRLVYKPYMQSVVDISVKVDNEHKDIVGVPSNANVHAYGDYVVSETKEAILSEVEAVLQNSKNILDSIDQHKHIIIVCENILKNLNPSYAKEQLRDIAIEDLTNQVNNMQAVLARLESRFIKEEQNEVDEKL